MLHYIMIDSVHFNQTPPSTLTKLEGVADMSSKYITKYFHSMCSLWRLWGHVVVILSMKRTKNNHKIRGDGIFQWQTDDNGKISSFVEYIVTKKTENVSFLTMQCYDLSIKAVISLNSKWMPEYCGNINVAAKMPVTLKIHGWMSQHKDWSGVKLIELTYLGLNQMADISTR